MAGPILLVGMVVGLIVAILQATTSIQEQTLSFVPKIAAILLALVLLREVPVSVPGRVHAAALRDHTDDMIEALVTNIRLFLLVFFRILAMVEVAPLLSSTTIPQVAKVGLSLFTAVTVFPSVLAGGYPIPANAVDYVLLVLGEAAIGLLIGFLLLLVFSAFQVAGQFFSLQMGFSASEVFDPLSQVEIPLMGEFLNLVAMLVFISVSGLGKFLLVGVQSSFHALRAIDLVTGRDAIIQVLVRGLAACSRAPSRSRFPILGTLLLVSITMGLLAKASPQMDVLTMGFPVSIGVSFLLLFATMPFLMTAFGRIIDARLRDHAGLLSGLARRAGR